MVILFVKLSLGPKNRVLHAHYSTNDNVSTEALLTLDSEFFDQQPPFFGQLRGDIGL